MQNTWPFRHLKHGRRAQTKKEIGFSLNPPGNFSLYCVYKKDPALFSVTVSVKKQSSKNVRFLFSLPQIFFLEVKPWRDTFYPIVCVCASVQIKTLALFQS
jgi:hypothetical protein